MFIDVIPRHVRVKIWLKLAYIKTYKHTKNTNIKMDVDDISQKSYAWNKVYKIYSVYNMLSISYI